VPPTRGKTCGLARFSGQAYLEERLGPRHFNVAIALENLAEVYRLDGRHGAAEPLYRRALSVWEAVGKGDAPEIAPTLSHYAAVLRALGRKEEAARVEQRFPAVSQRNLSDSPRP
jgi:tetratricopeptide (TPR) repeat protein